ncbi:hypothetical protein B0F90DRAFT_1763993 [Multifurca ochricompacta]|uniref:Uncharacterized protein n=1 Tax=Multifurca ochricompacta TaxID=376703 RepID=A0AAD4QK42_9AGAM|nr:hypothetical protein B0F90DRAFT_1763993 [Multifurca ochricompacta]
MNGLEENPRVLDELQEGDDVVAVVEDLRPGEAIKVLRGEKLPALEHTRGSGARCERMLLMSDHRMGRCGR